MKQVNFFLEIAIDRDGTLLIFIRSGINGQILKVARTISDVSSFLDEFIENFKNSSSNSSDHE